MLQKVELGGSSQKTLPSCPHRIHLTPLLQSHPLTGKSIFGHLLSSGCPSPDGKRDPSKPNDSSPWLGTALRGAHWLLRCHSGCEVLPVRPRSAPAQPRRRSCAAGAAGPLVQVDTANEFTRANCSVGTHVYFLIVRLFIMCTILLIFHISSVCMVNFVMGNSIAAVNINGI